MKNVTNYTKSKCLEKILNRIEVETKLSPDHLALECNKVISGENAREIFGFATELTNYMEFTFNSLFQKARKSTIELARRQFPLDVKDKIDKIANVISKCHSTIFKFIVVNSDTINRKQLATLFFDILIKYLTGNDISKQIKELKAGKNVTVSNQIQSYLQSPMTFPHEGIFGSDYSTEIEEVNRINEPGLFFKFLEKEFEKHNIAECYQVDFEGNRSLEEGIGKILNANRRIAVGCL